MKIRFRHYAPHHSNNNSKDSNVDNGNDNDNGDKDSVFLSSNQKTYFSRVVCRRGKRDVDVEASDSSEETERTKSKRNWKENKRKEEDVDDQVVVDVDEGGAERERVWERVIEW